MNTCPTCSQKIVGPDEPEKIGTVVVCSCGDRWIRKQDPKSQLGNPTTARWSSQTGTAARIGWLKILAHHATHQLSVEESVLKRLLPAGEE